MAEKVVSQTLVIDNHRDKLAKIINDVKLSLSDELLAIQKVVFCKMFLDLCGKYFGFRKFDLQKIGNDELLLLESEVFKKAERISRIIKYFFMPLMALIPIVGWYIIFDMLYGMANKPDTYSFLSYDYCKLRGILIEKKGKDFFPFEALK